MAARINVLKNSLRLAGRAARFSLREPATALLLWRMAAWVGVLSLLVRWMPLPTALKLLTPLRKRTFKGPDPEALKARLGGWLDLLLSTDILFLTPTCWKRAPVLYRFLALNGIESRVLFGMRRGDEGLLDGHAWVESDGLPVLERVAPSYNVTYSYPA